jgi:rSAM/selenodomain-associated transferase 2/rSAM/selenodomain-associated transferase 1
LNNRIIIFSRYPVPGKTKTRLIPALGPAGAADFQWLLLVKTFNTVKKFNELYNIDIEVCLDGGNSELAGCLFGKGPLYSKQSSGDIGERMHKAFIKAFAGGYERVILLGTDVPELETHHLTQAFDKLQSNDVVIGPSTDGGYWLIGMKHPVDIFMQIQWGTEDVFKNTIKNIKETGLSVHSIDTLTDIDTPENLVQWNPEYRNPKPYLSIIIPALNEADHIRASVQSSVCSDSEVLVVDGGSIDNTVQIAESAGARVIKSKPGRALQQNTGAAAARGKILLFLHADTLLPRNCINNIFEVMHHQDTILGAFSFKTDADGFLMNLVHLLTNTRARYFKLPYGDQALFLKNDIFEETGGFPEVPIAEDFFFVKHLSKKGSIEISSAEAVTSGRRWLSLGVIYTTIVNQIILAGCYLGVSPDKLALFHRSVK